MVNPKDKAIWNDELTRIFCELCVKEVEKGNRPTTHLNSNGWQNVLTLFQAKTAKDYGKYQLKNKWDTLKKEWKMWVELLKTANGIEWCPKKKTLDATDEWWNQRIQERPEVKVFKKRGFEPELNELLRCMFGDIVANGKHSLTPSGVLPGGASTEDATPSEVFGDSDEHDSLNEAGNENNLDAPNVEQEGQEGQEGQEVQEVVGSGQDKGKRKFSPRKSRGKRMAAQIDKLCDSMSSPRKVIPTAVFSPSRFGVEEAISALRAMQHEVPKMTYLYYFALELFHHQIKREIFLCIQPDERKWWLEREYEKHQAIARYPSFLASPPSCGFQPFQHIPPPPPGP